MTEQELRLIQLRICLEGGHCFLEGITKMENYIDAESIRDALLFVQEKFIHAIELLDTIAPIPRKDAKE